MKAIIIMIIIIVIIKGLYQGEIETRESLLTSNPSSCKKMERESQKKCKKKTNKWVKNLSWVLWEKNSAAGKHSQEGECEKPAKPADR